MFWIGMIVGIVIAITAVGGLFLWGLYVNKMSFREYGGWIEVTADALINRESSLQVWHDGELINSVIFEEK